MENKIGEMVDYLTAKLKQREEDGGIGTTPSRRLVEDVLKWVIQMHDEAVLSDKEKTLSLTRDKILELTLVRN